MRFTKILPVLGALMIAGAPAVWGQSCESATSCPVNHDVTVSIAKVVRLTITDPAGTPLSAPAPADFIGDLAVKEDVAATTVEVEANTPWNVTLHTNASNWSGPWTKPLADLEWQGGTVTDYQAISATPVQFKSGTATASDLTDIDYSTSWSIVNDVPGNYSLTLVFTATAP